MGYLMLKRTLNDPAKDSILIEGDLEVRVMSVSGKNVVLGFRALGEKIYSIARLDRTELGEMGGEDERPVSR